MTRVRFEGTSHAGISVVMATTSLGWWLGLLLPLFVISPQGGAQDFYVDGPQAGQEIDLMQAIDPPRGSPLGTITDITNISGNDSISYLKGIDGYPAFLIKRNANIRKPAAVFFSILPEDFAILITVIPSDEQGGFLFSAVNPANTIIQLGVSLSPVDSDGMMDINLYYTDYQSAESSQVLATFSVPSFVRQWTNVGLKVKGDHVTLYMDCVEYNKKPTPGRKRGLTLDGGSSLYIGKGNNLNESPFAGGLQQLVIVEDADKAETQCDDIDPYQEFSGSPDTGVVPGGGYPLQKGEKGDQGETGPQGSPGPPGKVSFITPPPITPPPPDFPGYKGEKGDFGVSGIKGDRGDRGLPGIPGVSEPGFPGSPGLPGLPGPRGEPGEFTIGIPGQDGATGREGAPGPRGPPGLPGGSGGSGDVGAGVPGLPGLPGRPGGSGVKGDEGRSGDPGRPGINGRDGEPGTPGAPGLPGLPGPPATYFMEEEVFGGSGEGDELFPGRPSGSTPGTIYPVQPTHPGTKGESGIPGVPGAIGPPGRNGVPGMAGMPGKAGQSGPRGEKGDMGDPGIGTPGLPGTPGLEGPPGPPGRTITAKGVDITGPPGNPGLKGAKGESGTGGGDCLSCVSVKGAIGPRGRPGPEGPRGANGIMGEIGLPGFPGRPGSRGLPGLAVKGSQGEMGPPGLNGGFVGGPGGSYVPGPPVSPIVCPPGRPGGLGPVGPPGEGLPGPPGPPGVPGRPAPQGAQDPEYLRPADGLPGFPGPPGPPGPQGPPGGSGYSQFGPDDNTFSQGAGAVTFRSKEELFMIAHNIPFGTIIFLLDEEVMYVRVQNGFREILTRVVQSPASNFILPTTPPPSIIQPPQDTSEVTGPMLHLIAANQPYQGDMNGISGADFICYKEARAIGLTGTYRAFISSRVQDLISIVHKKHDRKLPVVNLQNQKLFNTWNDIYNGAGAYFNDQVPIYSFDGKDVLYDPKWPQKIIWHGATSTGQRNEDSYCDAWSSDSGTTTGVGSSLIKSMILDKQEFSCNNAFILLCVENSYRIYRK